MRDDQTAPGGAGDEEALRGLLRGAVEGLEPADGALERLRCAVPARRRLKRQAIVGAAAVALLASAAVPAALHLTAGPDTGTGRSAMAGHGAEAGGKPGAASSDPHQNGSGSHPRATRSGGGAPEAGGTTGEPDRAAGGSPTGGVTAGPTSSGADPGTAVGGGNGPQPPAAASGVPGCGAEQLGVVGSARTPEADGKIYGSFKVTNVSPLGCAVTGPDTVTAAAAAGAPTGPGSGVAVVGHTAGDPASGLLPDPSPEAPVLVLPPNSAYEVRFAWVPPAEPCATASPDAGTKPPQGQSADTPVVEPETGATPPEAPGVAVSHTPPTGAPVTRTTITEACGGTVYRTGAIPVDAPAPAP